MEQFSLAEYLKNPTRKVVTRDGCPVRIICTDRRMENHQVVALIYRNGEEEVLSYRANGVYRYDKTPNAYDLFFAPNNKSVWVFLYKSSADFIVSFTCNDKTYAEQKMKELNGFALTEITWEE